MFFIGKEIWKTEPSNGNEPKFNKHSTKSVEILRQVMFFHTGQRILVSNLLKYFTDDAISKFEYYGYIKINY